MRKFLSLTLALMMTLALAVPAFAAHVPPSDVSDEDYGIMPLAVLYTEDEVSSSTGRWESSKFTATPDNGRYIRFWFENTTGEAVKVYLYRISGNSEVNVKSMVVPANGSKHETYNSYNADSQTYRLVIEAYVSGGAISGSVNVAQYTTNPNT